MSENERLQNLVRGAIKPYEDLLEPPTLIDIDYGGYQLWIPIWLYNAAIEGGNQAYVPLWKDRRKHDDGRVGPD